MSVRTKDHESEPSKKRELPSISVVVAVYNAEDTLSRCIESVISQTYSKSELLVLDGNSTDGSVRIVRGYEDHIAYWRSRPDEGVYDAWNEAIQAADNKFLCFLGADDWFADRRSLQYLAEAVDEGINFVSGKVRIVNSGGGAIRVVGKPWSMKGMHGYMTVAHPASLCERGLLLERGGFRPEYRIAGDYEFLLRAESDINATFVNRIVANMQAGGQSQRQALKAFKEVFVIQAAHDEIGWIKAAGNWIVAVLKHLGRRAREWFG